MTHRTQKVQVRIEPGLKAAAETIFAKLGLSSADAIRLFYKQVELREGLPFPIEVPNEKTLTAMGHLRRNRGKSSKS